MKMRKKGLAASEKTFGGIEKWMNKSKWLKTGERWIFPEDGATGIRPRGKNAGHIFIGLQEGLE